jgi:hypothetical protein
VKRPAAILAALGLVAAAFLIRFTQPSDENQLSPFVATLAPGQRAEGRDLTLEVQDAYLADRLTSDTWAGETDGVWLVIDATIGARLGVATPYATLTADGVQWTSSDRPDDAALGGSLDAGLPQSGSFVFELPTSLVESEAGRHAVVRFATAFTVRLDSVFDVPLDLGSLRHEPNATLSEPGVVVS